MPLAIVSSTAAFLEANALELSSSRTSSWPLQEPSRRTQEVQGVLGSSALRVTWLEATPEGVQGQSSLWF